MLANKQSCACDLIPNALGEFSDGAMMTSLQILAQHSLTDSGCHCGRTEQQQVSRRGLTALLVWGRYACGQLREA